MRVLLESDALRPTVDLLLVGVHVAGGAGSAAGARGLPEHFSHKEWFITAS